MISTKPYQLNAKEMLRVSIRDNYRRFWWLVPFALVASAFLVIGSGKQEDWIIAALLTVFVITAPLLRSHLMISKVKKSPLMQKEYVAEFEVDRLRQTSEGEVVSNLHYADFHKAYSTPEGIQIYLTPLTWSLIPREAFFSNEDYDEAVKLCSHPTRRV